MKNDKSRRRMTGTWETLPWFHRLTAQIGKSEVLTTRKVSVWVQLQVSGLAKHPHHRLLCPKAPQPLWEAYPPGALLCGPPQGGSSPDSSSGPAHQLQSVRRRHFQSPPPYQSSQAKAAPSGRWWSLGRMAGGDKDQLT